jgi:predicted O-methyltransferase YrrM
MSLPNATWLQVDDYIGEQLVPGDDVLDAALADAEAAGLPAIAVAPNQGKLLHLMARLRSARAILEIGTLGGYSAIWLARALPTDGSLTTLELDPIHAAVAQRSIDRAGLSDRVQLRIGNALDTLPMLEREGRRFDFVFIDADKINMPAYYEWALRLTGPGAAIICDNVVRRGDVVASASTDPNVLGVRALFTVLQHDSRVDATAIQTVGHKGYDGFLLAVVR